MIMRLCNKEPKSELRFVSDSELPAGLPLQKVSGNSNKLEG